MNVANRHLYVLFHCVGTKRDSADRCGLERSVGMDRRAKKPSAVELLGTKSELWRDRGWSSLFCLSISY